MIPATIALVVVQEMAARMGVVTGKGLADLIRENFGLTVTFWLMLGLFLTDLGNTAAEFAGWAASMELFGIPRPVSVPLGALVIWLLVVKGSYRFFERTLLLISLVYLTYVVAAIMARPAWGQVLVEIVRPSIRFEASYFMTLIGLIGTTITPWMQFYLQSAIVEKGVPREHYWATRADVLVGSLMTNVVAIFIMVACGATLYPAGVRVDSAEQAAMALTPVAGRYASALFAIGLANASLFSASVLPVTASYYICEAMGWEAGVDKSWQAAPQFMSLYTAFIVIGSLAVITPRAPLIPIMWLSQVLNGVVLPCVLVFMLRLVNREELMKGFGNSRFQNAVAGTTTAVMIALTLALLVSTLAGR